MIIGPLELSHYEAVREIYELGIATGQATFEMEAPIWDVWNSSHLTIGRLVALGADEMVWGWAALSPVSSRCVYAGVAEVSVYVHPDHRGQGVGRNLLSALIEASESQNIWTLQAGIFPENMASLRLHTQCGFRQLGVREKIGLMKGVWRDTLLLERRSRTVGV